MIGPKYWRQFFEAINAPFLRLGQLELTVVFILKLELLPMALFFAARGVRVGLKRLLSRAPSVDTGTQNAIAAISYYICSGAGHDVGVGSAWP